MMSNNSKMIQGVFDIVSRVYDHPIPQKLFYGRIHLEILSAAQDQYPREVLDAGCGTGELLGKLAELWPSADLIGLDFSEGMLEQAEAKDYGECQTRFINASVYGIPEEDDSIDLITNSSSSHFYTDISQALDEFYRILRPSGTLIMASITNGILDMLPNPFQQGLKLPEQTYRSAENLEGHLVAAGFNILEVKDLAYPVKLFVCQK